MLHAMANLVADSTPDFYLENIKQMVQHGIQPYFALGHVHSLELVERLIRKGYYMGPMNGFFSIGGGGMCGANPFDLMELIRRTPHGSFFTYQTTFRLTHPVAAICIALGQHTRAGIEDNLWNTTKGVRMSTIEMIERHVRMAKELGRAIATPEQARQMLKIGVTYKSTAETLANLGLPPNRRPGNMGFMVHETDGRFHPAAQGGCGHIHAGEWEEKVETVTVVSQLRRVELNKESHCIWTDYLRTMLAITTLTWRRRSWPTLSRWRGSTRSRPDQVHGSPSLTRSRGLQRGWRLSAPLPIPVLTPAARWEWESWTAGS